MSIRPLLLIALTLMQSACATGYVAPVGDSVARIRVVVPQSEFFASVRMMAYESGQCESPMSVAMIGGISRLSSEKHIGIPGSDSYSQGTFVERAIPAGRPYLFSLRGFYSNATCTITASFVPQANHDYEAKFTWGEGLCHTRLEEIHPVADGSIRRSLVASSKQESTCGKGFF